MNPAPAGYSGKPLAQKVALRPGELLLALDAPQHYRELLQPLPDGAAVSLAVWPCETADADVVHAFVRDRAELDARAAGLAAGPRERAALWISWPKKSSPLFKDLTEDGVRELMLPTGWVDVKVAAIDADWSGLMFRRRRS